MGKVVLTGNTAELLLPQADFVQLNKEQPALLKPDIIFSAFSLVRPK